VKKTLALILSSLMIASLGAGCAKTGGAASSSAAQSGTSSAAKETQLVISWWGNQTRNELTQKALDLYTQKNPNIKFDGQFAEWADYWNKLATASAAHNLPDIVQMDYKYIDQYVKNNLLVDLKPYVDKGTLNISKVDKGIIESGSVGGKLYAMCIGVNAPALLYNKTLLDEKGIKVKDNMTDVEFMALSKEIYEKTGTKTNVSYNNGDNFIEYTMRGQNILLFEQGKLGAKTAADFEPFFNFYSQGIKEGWHVKPDIFAERTVGSVEQDPMVYGTTPDTRSWCAFFYSNQMTALQKAAPQGVKLGITTWPSANPKASNYLKPSQFFSVTVDSKNPEEAAKFIDYWTNSVECNEILLGERGVPASSEVAEKIAPKLDEINKTVINYINNVVTPNSSTLNPPAPNGASEVFDLIDQLEEQLCYGKITSKQAAEMLFKQGNEIMASKK